MDDQEQAEIEWFAYCFAWLTDAELLDVWRTHDTLVEDDDGPGSTEAPVQHWRKYADGN